MLRQQCLRRWRPSTPAKAHSIRQDICHARGRCKPACAANTHQAKHVVLMMVHMHTHETAKPTARMCCSPELACEQLRLHDGGRQRCLAESGGQCTARANSLPAHAGPAERRRASRSGIAVAAAADHRPLPVEAAGPCGGVCCRIGRRRCHRRRPAATGRSAHCGGAAAPLISLQEGQDGD